MRKTREQVANFHTPCGTHFSVAQQGINREKTEMARKVVFKLIEFLNPLADLYCYPPAAS